MDSANSPEIENLKQALATFKNTGQVEPGAVEFAKGQFFPSRGLSPAEIANLGPVEVMLRLDKELNSNTPATDVPKTPFSSTPPVNLATEVANLENRLSQEVDDEVKRQLSAQNEIEQAQGQVSELVKKAETAPTPAPPPSAPVSPPPVQADPAVAKLKEGDKINEDWTLRRVYTTTFGNNPSPFYELENSTGATWTLNLDELKSILAQEAAKTPPPPPPPPPNLAPAAPVAPPEAQVIEKEKEKSAEKSSESLLTEKQIAFLKKLSESKEDWKTLLSINREQFNSFVERYKNGTLEEIGISATPLSDKLKDEDLVKTVTIKKGDNFEKLLSSEGYTLHFSSEDAAIFGLHLLLNYKLISESERKIEDTGISIAALPKEEEILKLTKKALADPASFDLLKESLTFLPLEAHFKIIKSEQFGELSKLI